MGRQDAAMYAPSGNRSIRNGSCIVTLAPSLLAAGQTICKACLYYCDLCKRYDLSHFMMELQTCSSGKMCKSIQNESNRRVTKCCKGCIVRDKCKICRGTCDVCLSPGWREYKNANGIPYYHFAERKGLKVP